MTDWRALATNSHYQTAVAVRDEMGSGDIEEVRKGIEELIDSLSRSDRRALQSHLAALMAHIIKWHTHSQKRSRSWALMILNARDAIADLQEDTPSLNRAAVGKLWARAWRQTVRDAEEEMGVPPAIESLTWDEIFLDPYEISPEGPTSN
jgi:hypothetical protein